MAGPARGRRLWLKIHKWIGLSFGVLFLLEAVTGCILVFQHEISDALDTPYASADTPIRVDATSAIELARVAEGGKPVLIGLPPSNPDHAYRIVMSGRSQAETRVVYVDPAWGKVSRDHRRPVQAVLDFIWSLHKRLAIPLAGDLLIAISGLVLTASTISGIVLWWPAPGKWGKALAIKQGARLARLTFDVHRVFGVCLAAMCLLWGISGTYMIQPSWIVGLLPTGLQPHNEQTARDVPIARGLATGSKELAAAGIAQVAARSPPGTVPMFLFPPRRPQPDCSWRVRLARYDDRIRYVGSATATVDACTGAVISLNDERGDRPSQAFYWLRPLHSGEAFGITSKVVVVLLGVGFLLFGGAGLVLWWARRRARKMRRSALLRR